MLVTDFLPGAVGPVSDEWKLDIAACCRAVSPGDGLVFLGGFPHLKLAAQLTLCRFGFGQQHHAGGGAIQAVYHQGLRVQRLGTGVNGILLMGAAAGH